MLSIQIDPLTSLTDKGFHPCQPWNWHPTGTADRLVNLGWCYINKYQGIFFLKEIRVFWLTFFFYLLNKNHGFNPNVQTYNRLIIGKFIQFEATLFSFLGITTGYSQLPC